MSTDRFLSLRYKLHFVNNLEISINNKDRFIKVRPLYNALKKRCNDFITEDHVSVDEQIIPFKGKLNINGKPNPCGIKTFALCGTSGLCFDFILYQESTTEWNEKMLKDLV